MKLDTFLIQSALGGGKLELELCAKPLSAGFCRKLKNHRQACDVAPTLWNFIENDPESRTKKKIVKAGFATPRGGDKGGYQNHVSRSSRVIIPFEHASKVNFDNYSQGAVVRVTVPQAITLLASGDLVEESQILKVNCGSSFQQAFILYRSSLEMQLLKPKEKWLPCWHSVNNVASQRRSATGSDFGHYLARIPRGLSEGIQQGIFAPEYVDKDENYACQILLTYLSYKTIGQNLDENFAHIELVLSTFDKFKHSDLETKGIVNAKGETCCPLCFRPIEFHELHEAIDPSQVPGLENSGVQLSETRSTLVNLYHIEPLLYAKNLGHQITNIAWGHAHCNTLLAQRRSFSLNELKVSGTKVIDELYWDEDNKFIRSTDNRAWVSVTPLPPGTQSFTDYLADLGLVEVLESDTSESDD